MLAASSRPSGGCDSSAAYSTRAASIGHAEDEIHLRPDDALDPRGAVAGPRSQRRDRPRTPGMRSRVAVPSMLPTPATISCDLHARPTELPACGRLVHAAPATPWRPQHGRVGGIDPSAAMPRKDALGVDRRRIASNFAASARFSSLARDGRPRRRRGFSRFKSGFCGPSQSQGPSCRLHYGVAGLIATRIAERHVWRVSVRARKSFCAPHASSFSPGLSF